MSKNRFSFFHTQTSPLHTSSFPFKVCCQKSISITLPFPSLHHSASWNLPGRRSVNKLRTRTKHKTLSLPVKFESLKAFLIFSRARIAIICLAKLKSFQPLFFFFYFPPSRNCYNSLNNNNTKPLSLTARRNTSVKSIGEKNDAYATVDGPKPTALFKTDNRM